MTTVLIVDDDDQLRSSLARYLRSLEYDVKQAESTAKAVEVITSTHVDVLVTDLRMAGEDGIDLIEQTRHLSPSTRTVLMSAYATARDHQTAMALGAISVLCKPFTSQELLNSVQQAVDCGVGFRGSVHGLSLIDLLQMFHYGQRSISVSIAGLVPGWIHVRGGEIFHAQHGDITGEAALRSLLSQSSGAITTGPLRSEAEASITRSFQSLLLDLLRQLDEGPDEAPQPTALPIEERRPTTFFPPSTEAALDAAFASIGATPSASIAIPAPPPPVSSQAPIATEALGENVGAIMQSMAGDSASASAMIVELATGRVTPLQGEPLPAEQALEATRSLVHLVERLTPDWQHYESLSGSIAVGLIRIQSSQAYLLVIEVMVGKYPIVRFRARLGRLAEVV